MASKSLPEALSSRLNQIADELRAVDFFILVWGPGEGEGFEKRQRIRNYLAELFGQESVFMSEDQQFNDISKEFGPGISEAIQAGAIDAVVALNTSIGTHTEIVKYEHIIANKAVVFVPYEHKESEGFAAVAYDVLKTESFTDEEYETCEAICKKARNFTQGLRFKKANLGKLRKIWG